MTTQAEIGLNRTGIATSPALTEEMIEGTKEFLPSSPGDGDEIALVREAYARTADALGSVAPPTTMKGAVTTAIRGIRGAQPTQFIDKLGERLAFERTGTRLYEALLAKFEATGSFAGGPTREELESILLEEHEHFRLLADSMAKLGGDPTVVTPSADLHATMSKGILEVVVDPRTSFAQCLEAALLAELADNDAWENLVELAKQNGEETLAELFASAAEEEGEHLENVRSWIAAALISPE
jgi:rubrerythrin